MVEEQFDCLQDNTEKYITFPVPLQRENANSNTIGCKIKFINSIKFMTSSLSNLGDNLAEELHKGECKDCQPCLEYVNVANSLLVFKFK